MAENEENRVIDLKELVSDLAHTMKPVAERKNLHFRYRIEHISASELAGNGRDQLHSILTELLENAVEYTPEGGDVIFCVRELMTDDRNSTIEFYVQDDGAGIPEEQLRKLRSMTRQEEAEADHGLAAVCREVRRLRGTVTFESGNGRGMGTVARVILTMPVSRVRPVRPLPDMNRDIYSFVGKKILLAEDHPLNLEIAEMMLERVGFEVDTAVNGREAVDRFAAKDGAYDAVLMDIRMPVMDGIEAVQVIRNMDIPGADTIPIIALTASAYEGDARRSRQAGMNEHLLKPIDPVRMYDVLSRYLYQSHTVRRT